MNNILVLQVEDRDDQLLNKLMEQNKKICLENNITYVNLKKSSYDVPPYWAKVFEIYRIMMTRPEIQCIMWLDSDAVFYNFSKIKLLTLLNKNTEYSMIISKDMPPWEEKEFNAGVFIIANDKNGHDIIKKWMKLYDPEKWVYFANEWLAESDYGDDDYEQGAFIKYIYHNKEYSKYIKQVPFYVLNNNNCCDNNHNIIVTHLAGYHKHNQVNIDNCLASFDNNDNNDNKILFLIIIIIIIIIFRFSS